MSLENREEYEADMRSRNLIHLKRAQSRLFDAASIARRFRVDGRMSRENVSSPRESEGNRFDDMAPSDAPLDSPTVQSRMSDDDHVEGASDVIGHTETPVRVTSDVEYCTTNYDGTETFSPESSQSPVRHYYMRPRSTENETQCSSSQILGRRRKVPWTPEEVDMLEEGVKLAGSSDSIPWTEILKYGSSVFKKSRTTVDLKDKWRNICKGKSKLR